MSGISPLSDAHPIARRKAHSGLSFAQMKLKLREIPFGSPIDDPDGYCIYAIGTHRPDAFITAVHSMNGSDIPEEARLALTVEDVEHCRFRRLSPSEARADGIDWGVMQIGIDETIGFLVTKVELL